MVAGVGSCSCGKYAAATPTIDCLGHSSVKRRVVLDLLAHMCRRGPRTLVADSGLTSPCGAKTTRYCAIHGGDATGVACSPLVCGKPGIPVVISTVTAAGSLSRTPSR